MTGQDMRFEKLCEIITEQQRGHEDKPRYMIGEQLKEIAEREPQAAEILVLDLVIKEMNLEAAEAKFAEYAQKHRKGARCYCITPKVAEEILREFYGLPMPEENATVTEDAPKDTYIDLGDFI